MAAIDADGASAERGVREGLHASNLGGVRARQVGCDRRVQVLGCEGAHRLPLEKRQGLAIDPRGGPIAANDTQGGPFLDPDGDVAHGQQQIDAFEGLRRRTRRKREDEYRKQLARCAPRPLVDSRAQTILLPVSAGDHSGVDHAGAMRAASGVFLILFLTSAWFHQGGGWNQNVRFSQIRAMAERGTFRVDDYVLYTFERDTEGEPGYRRVSLSDPEAREVRLPEPNGLDLSLYEGHLYPAKPPGTSFVAAPVYFAIHRLERAAGIDPDGWWPLTINLYLTTLLTVGLSGALGGVVFLLLVRRLFPAARESARVAATLTLGLGTLWLPYSTMLFDHTTVAGLCLLALALIRTGGRRSAAAKCRARVELFAAGTACGTMVMLNYGVVLSVVCLVVYGLALCRPRLRVMWLLAGGIAPALALAAYHQACFGGPFSIAYAHELEIFVSEGAAFLGVFGLPDPGVLARLLVGPYRGLLVTAPVLALGAFGVILMIRSPATRPEGVLAAAIVAIYLLQVSAFNGWHGGSAIGPRYLMPLVPFLGLGLVPAFQRLPRLTAALATVSVTIMLGVTAIDPQVDVEIANPLREYYWPLASGAGYQFDEWILRGPVSVQTGGPAGGELEVFYPSSRIGRWNSFNLGEAWFPESWLSLAPLLTAWAAIAAFCFRPRRSP